GNPLPDKHRPVILLIISDNDCFPISLRLRQKTTNGSADKCFRVISRNNDRNRHCFSRLKSSRVHSASIPTASASLKISGLHRLKRAYSIRLSLVKTYSSSSIRYVSKSLTCARFGHSCTTSV